MPQPPAAAPPRRPPRHRASNGSGRFHRSGRARFFPLASTPPPRPAGPRAAILHGRLRRLGGWRPIADRFDSGERPSSRPPLHTRPAVPRRESSWRRRVHAHNVFATRRRANTVQAGHPFPRRGVEARRAGASFTGATDALLLHGQRDAPLKQPAAPISEVTTGEQPAS